MNTDLLVIYQNINNFTQEALYPSSISKKNGALHHKCFLKHPLFTTFSLFLKVSEVCNVSSKCWLPNKSANKIFLHKKPYTPPLFQKKIVLFIADAFKNIHFSLYFYYFSQWLRCAILQIKTSLLVSREIFETSTFYHIFTIFKSDKGL